MVALARISHTEYFILHIFRLKLFFYLFIKSRLEYMRAKWKQFALKPVSHVLFKFQFEAFPVFTLVISSTRAEFGLKYETSFSLDPPVIILLFHLMVLTSCSLVGFPH